MAILTSFLLFNIIIHHEEIGCKYFHFKIKIVLHTISSRYTTFWFPSFWIKIYNRSSPNAVLQELFFLLLLP